MKNQDNQLTDTTADSYSTNPVQALRERAEEQVRTMDTISLSAQTPEEIQGVLHELLVHQIELEMQNEDLRAAQVEIEAGRARYFDLYDLAPVGYCTLSEQGLILEANLTAATLLNVPRSTLVKQPISRFILFEDKDTYYLHRKKLFKTGQSQECELRLVKPNGEFFWAHLAETTALGEDDAPVYRTVISDITERKQAVEALRKSETRYRTTIDTANDAIVNVDNAGNIVGWNPSAEKIFGYTEIQVYGQPLTLIIPTLNRESYLAGLACVQTSGEKHILGKTIEFEGRHKNGSHFPLELSLSDWQIGEDTLYTAIIRNITERKQAEEERLKLKKLESVGLLAGGIAHDFNNLLTGLFGNIELAKMSLHVDHKSYQYLEAAGYSMDSAVNLTKQLLTFAKGGDPIKETLSIGEVIIETTKFSLRGSNIKLKSNIAPDLWLVDADRGQLSQVISNLVINAQQAMPTGGIISITAENIEMSEGQYVQIIVQDEGVGIAPQYLDKIFDPYFSTKEKGNGLGLATLHSILSKHNGTITVASHVNQGATFTIRLPAAEQTEKPATGKVPVKIPVTNLSSARILVMDDEDMVREVMGKMLEKLGHKVRFAINGQEAIVKYKTAYEKGAVYDVVITDLTIPGGMGGEETAQEILKIDPQAKIIVCSGYATHPVIANYAAYGFTARIVKPYGFVELQKAIQQVLKT